MDEEYEYYEDLFGSQSRLFACYERMAKDLGSSPVSDNDEDDEDDDDELDAELDDDDWDDDEEDEDDCYDEDEDEEELDDDYFLHADIFEITEGMPWRQKKLLWKLWKSFGNVLSKQSRHMSEMFDRMEDFFLEMKYVEFDLSATRRERDDYYERWQRAIKKNP
ncbi:hypothetical protein FACS1894170_09430 [Planctomycetales bacterium]|nr:hypothetical protein FACS1894170_09430 [Planctomycetales bacterium]